MSSTEKTLMLKRETGIAISVVIPFMAGVIWIQSAISGLAADIRVLEQKLSAYQLINPSEMNSKLSQLEYRVSQLEK